MVDEDVLPANGDGPEEDAAVHPGAQIPELPQLPPPVALESRSPIVSLLLAGVAGIASAAGLFAVSRYFYPFVVGDLAVGFAVGYAIILGLRGTRYHVERTLFALTFGAVALAYLLFAVAAYFDWARQFPNLPLSVSSFLFMLQNKALTLTLPGDLALGMIGNAIAAGLLFALALYVAWSGVQQAARLERARTVPVDVVEAVLQRLREGYKDDHIRQAMAARGWSESPDQDRALSAARACLALGLLPGRRS